VYYYNVAQFTKPDKHANLKLMIAEIFHENKGRYGYRRIQLELRNRQLVVNHKLVRKLMRVAGIACKVRIKKYKSYRGLAGKISPNLLERDFSCEKPNEKWVTDVTEFSLFGQKLYLSPILDLYNGELISYNLSRSANFRQTVDMLGKAFDVIPNDTNLILHSDQGWQYQMKQYCAMLEDKGIRQSMSRKGNCLDNAVMENFFGILKSELLYLQEFSSIEHFTSELEDYIHYYNHKRIKAKLKGLTPVQFRIQSLSVA
jgi:transposase InsO family protein